MSNPLYASVGNLPHTPGIDNGMVPNPQYNEGGKLHIQGIMASREGYQTAVFTRCGTAKNYTLVTNKPKENYGAFSISAAVRPGGMCRCGNACGCNCAHGGACKCPYLSGVS